MSIAGTPQKGIFDFDCSHFHHLEYQFNGEMDIPKIRQSLAAITSGDRKESAIVICFGARLWKALTDEDSPEKLNDFEEISGCSGYRMPATQGDLMLWIKSTDTSNLTDAVLESHSALKNSFQLALEVEGFTYHDSRDLIGFVDGTANPKEDARYLAAQIPVGEPAAGEATYLAKNGYISWMLLSRYPLMNKRKSSAEPKQRTSSLKVMSSQKIPTSAALMSKLMVSGKKSGGAAVPSLMQRNKVCIFSPSPVIPGVLTYS